MLDTGANASFGGQPLIQANNQIASNRQNQIEAVRLAEAPPPLGSMNIYRGDSFSIIHLAAFGWPAGYIGGRLKLSLGNDLAVTT